MKTTDEELLLMISGKLDEQARTALEERLAADPGLAQEAQFLAALREGIQAQDEPVPGELGLARLKRSIEQEQAKAVQPVQREKFFWKPVALAACALLGLQTLIVSTSLNRVDGPTDIAPMSGAPSSQGPQLQVVFRDETTAAQMRAALMSVGGTIVDGPGALGVLTLALPVGTDRMEAQVRLQGYDFVEEVVSP